MRAMGANYTCCACWVGIEAILTSACETRQVQRMLSGWIFHQGSGVPKMGKGSGTASGFLPDADPARRAWAQSWPIPRRGQNWDAIARLRYGAPLEWLLIE